MEQKKHADCITLAGIKILVHVGVTAEERAWPQECKADLEIWGDFKAVAATDSLDQAIDYSRVLAGVQETASKHEYRLLETLAYAIIEEALKNFPVTRARVKIRKHPAILLNKLDYVEVRVEGTQAEC